MSASGGHDRAGDRPGAGARVASRLDRRAVEQLGGDAARAVATDRPRRRRAEQAAALALATPVLLVLLLVAGGGLWLVVAGDNPVLRVCGGLLLLVTALLAPRVGPVAGVVVDPAEAPVLAALVGEVAAGVGTRVPDVIRLDHHFNASAVVRGLGRRELTVGAPLWSALPDQARVALLAHELGHFAHRDALHGRYVWLAHRALVSWHELVTPTGGVVSGSGEAPLWATVVTAPLRLAIGAYLRLLRAVNALAARRQELYADLAAVGMAGTDGAVVMLEHLLLADAVEVAANRAAVDPARPSTLAAVRARMATITPAERAAARVRGAAERSSIDSSHPSTVERLRLVEAVPRRAAAVVLDGDRAAALERELAPSLRTADRALAETFRYVR